MMKDDLERPTASLEAPTAGAALPGGSGVLEALERPFDCARCLKTIERLAEELSAALQRWEQAVRERDAAQDALPDPGRLELLADWIDSKYPGEPAHKSDVQYDLRSWAQRIRAALLASGS